ncbi:DUF3426 domain-containing protein [Mariluticola halotolerans]|uniref:DUF3426 domain-containing protein n=1 Tax=Mariluticola halotolerans TaxID=2909283 RepID=UPI0026E13727|nr:DUF3426 domain-containing protein [Mariluticola halotolerans]UJQ93781.1 zinc-ribbon domain-containing protein [Mariluticola halotolerans]
MIITCPNCQTRYQVAEKAIGSAGRKVQCAHCHQSWQAVAEKEDPKPKPKLVPPAAPKPARDGDDDRLFDAADEAALDAAFEREETRAAPVRGKSEDVSTSSDETAMADAGPETEKAGLDTALQNSRHKAMLKRQINFARNLPMSQIRGNMRIAAICLLALLVGGGYFFRTEVVRLFPDLAGVYEAVGLKVNVVGLEFRNVETLRAVKSRGDVMVVSGRIQNITGQQVKVPAIVVTLCDDAGVALYSWSVTPVVSLIGPGENVEFETQLNAPPDGVTRVKLAFADGRAS